MNQIGVHPTKDNNIEKMKSYTEDGKKWIYAFLRNLQEDLYVMINGNIYLLEYNQDYFDKSKTLMGKFEDSRKIPFENLKKVGIFDSSDKNEEEGSGSDKSLDISFYAAVMDSGEPWLYKVVNGNVVASICDGRLTMYLKGFPLPKFMSIAEIQASHFEQEFEKFFKV